MSLTMRADNGRVHELKQYVETLLAACVDYHNTLVRCSVPDPVTGRAELQRIYKRFELELEPRSLYGEKPRKGT